MPFKDLKFCFSWRNYQEEFLKNFENHISDNHLHVIAPPGSGKTILGIEILRRLNKKTLVLSPTLTIRNQWLERLHSFFDIEGSFTSFSFDVSKPSDIIFSTYQGLHSFYKKCGNKEVYFEFFKANGIEVIVLDEAHHLKNEWWKCLYELKETHQQTVVALTATPPYDSDAVEVNRYFKLCGEIDDEIVVPDLVKEGDLCPHQDFVFFSKPNDVEINFITDYRLKISDFISSLEANQELITMLKEHRFLVKTSLVSDEIYNNPEYFSSVLIFLNCCKIPLPNELFYTLGFDEKEKFEIPLFDLNWAQILLQNLLVGDRKNLESWTDLLEAIEKALKRIHAFEKNSVDFIGSKTLYRSLSNSSSKLSSINTIIQTEQQNLNTKLRAVVLTDYIKKEFLFTDDTAISKIDKIGVVPIFYNLKQIVPKTHLAILSGTLVIVHKSLAQEISEELPVSITKLNGDEDFVILNEKSISNAIVQYITKLFEEGKITVLIGTKSLLGEGWDAPSINTLIMASFIGSFVSSNQMRGRAVRTQSKNPNKTGNIWHLVCLDPTDSKGGKDMETLERRFTSYVGVSNQKPIYIESGLDRLYLPTNFENFNLDEFNSKTLALSQNRDSLKTDWETAIRKGSSLTREIKQYYQGKEPYQIEKQQKFKDAVKKSFIELTIGLSVFLPQFLIKNLNVLVTKGMLAFIYSLLTALGLTFGVKSYQSIKAYLQFGYLHKDLEKIIEVLLRAMLEKGFILTPFKNIDLQCFLNDKGDVVVSIKGVSNFESSLFINAISQIMQPIQNPRYLIVRTNWFREKFEIQNYYSVPDIFGDKKENCLLFEKHWQSWVGNSKIVFTRNIHGRKLLLKARIFHVSNSFNKTTKKAVIWN